MSGSFPLPDRRTLRPIHRRRSSHLRTFIATARTNARSAEGSRSDGNRPKTRKKTSCVRSSISSVGPNALASTRPTEGEYRAHDGAGVALRHEPEAGAGRSSRLSLGLNDVTCSVLVRGHAERTLSDYEFQNRTKVVHPWKRRVGEAQESLVPAQHGP